jgi:hypothetical protein
MSKREMSALAAAFLCILLLAVPVPAMESDNYAINWDVMGSGGGPVSSASYALYATIGQAAIDSKSSTTYGLCSGYWCGTEVELEPAYAAYLPLVLRDYTP